VPASVRQLGAPKSKYAKALETAGVDRRTAQRFQQLADVPAETFEAAMRVVSAVSLRVSPCTAVSRRVSPCTAVYRRVSLCTAVYRVAFYRCKLRNPYVARVAGEFFEPLRSAVSRLAAGGDISHPLFDEAWGKAHNAQQLS